MVLHRVDCGLPRFCGFLTQAARSQLAWQWQYVFFLVLFRSSGKLASFTQNRIQLIRALVNPFVDPFVGKF
jgi:hypothetical protein